MFKASDLPKPTSEECFQPTNNVEDFKIAWRYNQNPIYDSKPHHTSMSFGHTFDMSAKIPVDQLQNIKYWPTEKFYGIFIFNILQLNYIRNRKKITKSSKNFYYLYFK